MGLMRALQVKSRVSLAWALVEPVKTFRTFIMRLALSTKYLQLVAKNTGKTLKFLGFLFSGEVHCLKIL